jgi:hypothetical protein
MSVRSAISAAKNSRQDCNPETESPGCQRPGLTLGEQIAFVLQSTITAVFARVHSSIGHELQLMGLRSILRINGNADASGSVEDQVVDIERRVEAILKTSGDFICLAAIAQRRDEGDKLVPADASQCIAAAQSFRESFGHFLQIDVANPVPVAIVDPFELI